MTHVINRGSQKGGHPIADATARAEEAAKEVAIAKAAVAAKAVKALKPKRKPRVKVKAK